MIAQLQQLADRNIARFGLLGDGQPVSGSEEVFSGQLPPADAHIPPVTDAPVAGQSG
jgi:hypothetical protein